MEKYIRMTYLFMKKVKLIAIALYCTYMTTCILYYLTTTPPEEEKGYTWIESLKLSDYIWMSSTTSIYFSIVTMATVAILKGSKTFRYWDKMCDLTKSMTVYILGRILRNQIKGHSRLQYGSSYTDAIVLQMYQTLYQSCVENIPFFKGCSQEFINEIVTRVHEDFFLPGEVIMEEGNVVDQLYFVCQGVLEEVGTGADGLEESVSLLEHNSSFGDIPILDQFPEPYTVRVREQCRLLRVDRQTLSNILEIYLHDSRKVMTNVFDLCQRKESNLRLKQSKLDIMVQVSKQRAALILRVHNAVFDGDLYQLKSIIRSGADPNMKFYTGETALHLAASRGHEKITLFLIQESVDINAKDNFGNTPLFEAIKNGHDKVASLLSKSGAKLKIDNAGSYLCLVVLKRDSDLLRRLLIHGLDPNLKNYDHRSPLHIAASQGLYLMGKMLVLAGANVLTKDKCGKSPIDEARICGNKNMIRYLEEQAKMGREETHAKKVCDVLPFRPWDPLEGRYLEEEAMMGREETHEKKVCSVLPCRPWDPIEGRKRGIRMWVPHTMEELTEDASYKLRMLEAKCMILSEEGCQVTDVDTIVDRQRLYLVYETK
ncbi:potassium channel SKOR-like isoform X2 [Salvia splendens]|uniref:potassium channel SKOR-like isoform X2 n=1 Tax=Salvia splendens TaxID=180675 RepID=UPI001C25AE4C|nr:potassium channel SKOR-like isoform X2 [Salvia splendens]